MVVIDAPIAAKWFNIEDYSHNADKLRSQDLGGEFTLNAPVDLQGGKRAPSQSRSPKIAVPTADERPVEKTRDPTLKLVSQL